jgi:transposase
VVWEVDLQSEHKSSTSSFEVIEAEVSRLDASPGRPRRQWSTEAKERIVAAACEPGVNVSAIARTHGLSPQQVFTWRRQAGGKSGKKEKGSVAGPAFAMIALEDAGGGGVVEIAVGGVTLRISAAVPAARVKEILQAVRSA